MPTVSVVIPTYNRADVVPRAIESVLEQTYEDLELVVVDDGSTDGTGEVLDTIDDPRLRVVPHETNRGANVARNTGLSEADGEYVAFLDSDDEWVPEKLERQIARLESKPDEYVAVYCDFERATDGARSRVASAAATVLATADEPRPVEGGDELRGEILADNLHSGAGSTLLVETETAREVRGFDESLDRFQDPEFLLRVVDRGKLAFVDEPLVVRHDTGSPSAETVARADEQFLRKHSSLVDGLEADGFQIEAAHSLVLAKLFLRDGEYRTGLAYLYRAQVPPRHWPGVLSHAGSGLGRRVSPTAVAVLVGTVLTLWYRRLSGS